MGKIIRLEQRLANMIAAGEVIERLGNVVKELVENAIDANATAIDIALQDAGMTMIRITDNGSGMDQEDALLAFERHATSKIHSEYELYHLASLGFRGEALASISAVSKVELTTSMGGNVGHKVIYQDGKLISEGMASPRKGTDVMVSRLFYNMPARLKHLKSPQSELAYIVDLVNKLALSHPSIAMTLQNDGKRLLNTSGNGKIIDILGQIYGIDVIRDMLPFEGNNRDYHISGLLATPLVSRASKNAITVLVNHRIVRSVSVIQAIIEGLDQKLPKGRYPVALINIVCDPLLIDANIHPTKQEVKFSDDLALYEFIKKTIEKAGESFLLVQQAHLSSSSMLSEAPQQMDFSNLSLAPVQTENSVTLKSEHQPLKKPSLWPDFDYIGQYRGTYLLFQNDLGLYLVDQHAAAERIRYERYAKKMADPLVGITELLVPMNIDFSNHEMIMITPYIETLEKFGLKIEPSSPSSFFIRTIPSWFPKGSEIVYAETIIRTLMEQKPLSIGIIMDELAILLACKHSIKANRFINASEVQTLLSDLSECEHPQTCPHGRPIMVKIDALDIEKWFRRVV
jgi:DNA mismatch repair protein MutL